MIKSMTGFGRAKYDIEGRQYIVEIKSVNNRYCDISVKIPRAISYLEENVKSEVAKVVSRGKVDVFVSFYNNNNYIIRTFYIKTLFYYFNYLNVFKQIYQDVINIKSK